MKLHKHLFLPFLAVTFAFLVGGCEHDGDDSLEMGVSASTEEVYKGETCVLHAWLVDWEDDAYAPSRAFQWSLSDPSIGYLSRDWGRDVVYHPTHFPVAPEREIVQTVYCKYEGVFFNNHTRQKIVHLPLR